MTEAKLPIFRTAFLGWRDGLAALRLMPTITAFVFAVMVVDIATDDALRLAATAETTAQLLLLRLSISVTLCSFALTPAAIAIHRYVLLGEITRRYVLNLSSPGFRMFVAYSALVNVLVLVPMMVAEVATDIYIIGAVITLGLVALAVLVGTLILFPAIAVDAPGTGIRNAVQDVHVFRALLILIVTVLPPLAMSGALSFVIWGEETPSGITWDWIFYVVLGAAVSSVLFAVFTAMASHLYRAWAFQLGRPSVLAT